jgi:hypothetical protein
MNLPEHGQRIEFIPKGCKHPQVGEYLQCTGFGLFEVGPDSGNDWLPSEVTMWRGVDETEWRKI